MKRKIKFCRQISETECGLCCISMILSFYNTYQPLSYYRAKTQIGRDGLTFPLLISLLKTENIDSEIYEINKYKFGLKPVIAFSKKTNHFVVIESKKKIIVYDPNIGHFSTTLDFLNKNYDYIIECKPNKNYIPHKTKLNDWRHFTPIIIENKINLIKLTLSSFIVYALSTSITYIVQKTIDSLEKNTLTYNPLLLIIPTIITFLFILISFIRNKVMIEIELFLDKKLNIRTFEKILKLPLSFFNSRGSSEIIYRMTLLQSIREVISNGVVNIIIEGGMIFFLLIYSIKLNFVYTTFLILLSIFTLVYIILINKKILINNQKSLIANSELMNVEYELVSILEYIKATGNEAFILNKFKLKLKDVLNYFKKSENLLFSNKLILDTLSLMGPFFLFFSSLYFEVIKNNSLGEKITLYMISNMIISKSTVLFQNFTSFEIMKSILERLNDIYDNKNEDINKKGSQIDDIKSIEFKNVCFSYTENSKPTLKNISFNIKCNERIAFVGPSGAGKSTILKLLGKLYDIQKGKILINGININDINLKSLRTNMNLIPQNKELLEDSILNNITLGRNFSIEEIKTALKVANFKDEISQFPLGLNTRISEITNNISGGQKQRILIARAILQNNSLLLLDEATSALDYITEKNIVKQLKNVTSSQIIIAHRLSTILDADRIYYMQNGEIIEYGSHSELMEKKGAYFNMYNYQKREESQII